MAKKVEGVQPQNGTSVEVFENMDNALSTSEAFVEQNKQPILIGLGVLALVIIAVMCFKTYYLAPKEQAAKESIFKAEQLFAKDSFQLALDGNDDVMGFLEIIDEYGSTDAGNLAKAYAGVCYKMLGNNDDAIKYLDKFDADDNMIQPAIKGAMGDCYWDNGEVEKAISFYKKAASANNDVITPFYNKRAALACMSIGKNDEAVKLLESIVKDYPMAPEMNDAKKLLEMAKAAE